MSRVESAFTHLFTPIRLGPVTVKNKVYMTPHSLNYADPVPDEPWHFLPSERHAYYYAERAKGGVGLIIMEGAMVHPRSDYHPILPSCVYDPRCIPRLQKISSMVHEHEAKIFVELWHAGQHCNSQRRMDKPGDWYVAMSASATPAVEAFMMPRGMSQEEIEEVEEAFGKAALYVKKGGFDGVEVHATHSYLIEQFLSPFYNKRADRYGGSLENRMRFMVEVLERIRRYVGQDLAVGARLIADELMVGGLSNDDMREIAGKLEDTKLIDFLDLDIGTYHTFMLNVAPMYVNPSHQAEYIAGIKAAVSKIPILGCAGRLTDLHEAERLLSEGKMDMVGGSRGFIAEPELVKKSLEGRQDEIVKCIACNQFCHGRVMVGLTVHCTLNPVTGREKDWGIGTLKPTATPKYVLVVGGGPGGMEAARVAALRGHRVTLCEKEERLGGQMRLGAMLPGREVISTSIEWYERQLFRLGAKVLTGKRADSEFILRENPDVVVMATGSSYQRSGVSGFITEPIRGWDKEWVVTPEQILAKKVDVGRRVMILDDEGFVTAVGLAEMFADQGKEVEVVTRWHFVGPGLFGINAFHIIYAKLLSKKIRLKPNTYIKEVTDRGVVLYNIFTSEEETVDVDTLVMTTSKAPDDKLYHELKDKVKELYLIGDSLAPRSIGEAIFEGHSLARTI